MKIWGIFYAVVIYSRSRRPELFCKKDIIRNFTSSQENTSARVSFLIKLLA